MPVVINGSSGVSGADGSVGTPAYQGSDTNTGMFFPAADTIAFAEGGTEVMRIAANGNVGIGSSTPGDRLYVNGGIAANGIIKGEATGGEGGQIELNNPGNASIGAYLDVSTADSPRWFTLRNNSVHQIGQLAGTGGAISFVTEATERARITGGGAFLLGSGTSNDPIGTNVGAGRMAAGNTASDNALNYFNASGPCLKLGRSSDGTIVSFFRNTTTPGGQGVGEITVTSSGTSYVTTSDYRLKENVVPLTDSITRVLALKPSRFNFIVEPGKTVDGFLAHEAAEVVPEAVVGEKDAVNENGSIVPQGIDFSRLVPLLTAALQEALTEIASLKDRVTELESR